MRKKLILFASLTILALSCGGLSLAQPAYAAVTNPVQVGKTLNAARDTFIYTRKGKKIGTLQRGKRYRIRALKKVNGQLYVRIGRNRFVKANAFLPRFRTSTKIINRIKQPSLVYDINGHKIDHKILKRGTKVNFKGHKEINNRPFIYIGNGEYVKAINVLTIAKII